MKIILLSFVFFCSLASTARAQQFKIQTLNFNAEAPNARLAQARYEILRNYIQVNDLDVMLMQEVWHFGSSANVAVQIAQDLNYDVVYHFEDGVTGIYVTSTAILAKKTLRFRNPTSAKLPGSAWTLGDGTSTWLSLGETNILVGGTITLPSGQDASIWSTHLSAHSQTDRIQQIQFAIDFIKTYSSKNKLDWNTAPAFIGGDMNSDPKSAEASLFRESEFVDSWLTAHRDSPGLTTVNDPLNLEYNPMVHSSGQIPLQYTDQGTSRIDYIYSRNLSRVGIGAERIFTAPQGRIWMSDHYSVLAQFNFDSIDPELPDSDSDFAAIGPPTIYSVTDAETNNPSLTRDFDVSSLRGFTLINAVDAEVDFIFVSNIDNVYNTNSAYTEHNDIASFTFFASGDYRYIVRVKPNNKNQDVVSWGGTVHVH